MSERVAVESCDSRAATRVFERHPGRETTLGGLPIRRVLPLRGRRLIGPWCFLDRYGPLSFTDRKPMDVAPHPHIGIQTVSWLLEGEIVHRDSLGYEALVRPGGVNVMTSGSGIAHSEETPAPNSGRLSGVQLWIALPEEARNGAPSFQHLAEVPRLDVRGGEVCIFAGDAGGVDSGAERYSDLAGLDGLVAPGEVLELPLDASREHGVFVLSGEAELEGEPLETGTLYYLGCGRGEVSFRSDSGARLLIVGGKPLAEPVLMWWNFVARTPDEIAQARSDWEEGRRFGPVRGYAGARLSAPALSRLSPPNAAS